MHVYSDKYWKMTINNISTSGGLTEESHKDVFNECPTGPNLDLFCIQLLNAGPFCENYAKLRNDTNHLEKGLNRGNFLGPFF